MSFQAYIDNIRLKTGKSPEDFYEAAKEKDLLGANYKTKILVDWLKADYGLGHGHAMAIVQAFKNNGWIEPRKGGHSSPVR